MVQVIEETSNVGSLEKTGGPDCHSCGGLLFGCEVRGFSNKEEKEYEALLWSRVVFGITRQKRGELERDEKTLADLRISCKVKPILDLIQIRHRLEKLFSEVTLLQNTQPV